MKFAVDCMLGKLAKWLKILGFDTVYFSKIEDKDLVRLARNESRILLTRDTGILSKSGPPWIFFIQSEDWREQISQVIHEFELEKEIRPFSRCIDCNRNLKDLPKPRARNLVTPFVYGNAESFSMCPDCGRVFWKGTHHKDMIVKIKKILK